MNIIEGVINEKISFAGYGLQVIDDQGIIKLGPSKANSEVFLVREEGPLRIIASNEKLIINYGGQYLLEVESSEERGHIINILQQDGEKRVINANDNNEYGIERAFGEGKVKFDEGGKKVEFYMKDEEVKLEISFHIDGFNEKRKLKYIETNTRGKFYVEMKSRSEMNLEEINKVEQELLESNRAGMRSANMGIGRSAVAGAITRSFDVFREHSLQVLRDGVPVIEL